MRVSDDGWYYPDEGHAVDDQQWWDDYSAWWRSEQSGMGCIKLVPPVHPVKIGSIALAAVERARAH